MKLNVIIPCYNEAGNIELMHEKLTECLKDIKYELIFINDGSKDETENIIKKIYIKDKKHVRFINFSRNFGKDAAMYAGLTHANAEYTVIVDGDLQQNPSYLLKMLNFLEENPDYDQVAMINTKRSNESALARFLKGGFYKFINMISDTKFKNGVSDFRMFRKEMVNAIISLTENNRFSKGIFSWVGFKTKYMPYNVEERHAGKSNFNITKSFKYAWDGIVNFSNKPLRIATVIGSLTSIGAFIYLIIIIIKTLIKGIDVPGYASIISLILLFGGLNLLAIGILGEYIAKMHIEIKKRPIYIAKYTLGFDEDDVL